MSESSHEALSKRIQELEAHVEGLEARLAEAADTRRRLALSEERFRLAFKTSPDAISLTRAHDGRMVDVNEGFTRITGWERDEVLGRTTVELGLWTGDTRERMAGDILERGECINLEAKFRTKDGRLIDGLFSARAIELDGEVHLLSVARDITALRQAMEERERLRERLSRAERMELVGRLASGVAHDFNNMLTVICGFTGLLSQSMGDDPRSRDVAQIEAAAMRAADLTRQLLAYGRRQVLTPEAIDPGDLIDELLEMLRAVLGPEIACEVDVDEGVSPIFADRGQVERVLTNLAVNARDAMPGGGTLSVRVSDATRDGEDFVLIEIEDSGVGMSEETLEHIFDPFFSTKGPDKGTGLGLSSVLGIVRQSGGFLDVSSELGHGTIFAVHLPRARSLPTRPAFGGTPSHPGEGEGRILVVDDDEALRELLGRTLEAAGFEVIAADDGASALEAAEALDGPPVAVITDIVMPEMPGPELVRRLRQRWGTVRVLFITGYADLDTVARVQRTEGTALLRKVFTPPQLLSALHDLLHSGDGVEHQRDCG